MCYSSYTLNTQVHSFLSTVGLGPIKYYADAAYAYVEAYAFPSCATGKNKQQCQNCIGQRSTFQSFYQNIKFELKIITIHWMKFLDRGQRNKS